MNDIVRNLVIFDNEKVKEGDLLIARDKDGKPYKGLIVHVSYDFLEFVYIDSVLTEREKDIEEEQEDDMKTEKSTNEKIMSIFTDELQTKEKEGWKIQIIRPEWNI